jgi:hypothetical protein
MSPRRTERETERETESSEEEEPHLQTFSTPDLANAQDCKKQGSDLQEASSYDVDAKDEEALDV